MKLLITLFLTLTCFSIFAQTNLSNNLQINAPKALDNRSGIFSSGIWRSYASTTEANTTINSAYRFKGMTVQVNVGGVPTDYWYRDSTLDGSLVLKTFNYTVPTLNQVLTAGNTTLQTIVSGNIIPSNNGVNNIGIPVLKYNREYVKHIHLNDTITDLNQDGFADYDLTATGRMRTQNSITVNDSFGRHRVIIGEKSNVQGVPNADQSNRGATIQVQSGYLLLASEDGTGAYLDQKNEKFTMIVNQGIIQGGQSTDGRFVGKNNGGDTTLMLDFSNSYQGMWSNTLKVGGYAKNLGTGLVPSNIILDVAGVTQATTTGISKIQGVRLAPMTTTQRDAIVSPEEGLEIYNLTTHTKNYYNGTAWKEVLTAP